MKIVLRNGKSISLNVLPLEKLLPHEDVIPSLVRSVTLDMERTCSQRDPIIIDGLTKVVLDGMHRRKALSSFGARFALCSAFDYLNQSVVLERWLRYFIAPDRKFINEIVSLLGMRKSKNLDSAIMTVDDSRYGIALLSSKESYVANNSTMSPYGKLANFDELARSQKVEVQFRPGEEIASMFSSVSVFVLYPPKVRKKQILEMAKKGRVLPYKTTRHILPTRPMGLYYPLDLLVQSNLRTCSTTLERIVAESKIDLLEDGGWYEGREYSEPLAIFRRE